MSEVERPGRVLIEQLVRGPGRSIPKYAWQAPENISRTHSGERNLAVAH